MNAAQATSAEPEAIELLKRTRPNEDGDAQLVCCFGRAFRETGLID